MVSESSIKFVIEQAMKAQRWSRMNLSATRGCAVKATPLLLHRRERKPVPLYRGLVGPIACLDMYEISSPHRDSIP
jgi:hypothetical protein